MMLPLFLCADLWLFDASCVIVQEDASLTIMRGTSDGSMTPVFDPLASIALASGSRICITDDTAPPTGSVYLYASVITDVDGNVIPNCQ